MALIKQWIDAKTGLGYSSIQKKNPFDYPAPTQTANLGVSAAPKAITMPAGASSPQIAQDVSATTQTAQQPLITPATAQPGAQPQNTAFMSGVMDLLKNYQKLGTAKYDEAGLRARGEMASRVMTEATPGMSPGQQGAIRSADVSAEQPNYAGAQEMGKTFAEQLQGMGSALEQARLIGESFQAEEQSRLDREESRRKEQLTLITQFPSAFKMLPEEQKKQIEEQIGYKGLIDMLPDSEVAVNTGKTNEKDISGLQETIYSLKAMTDNVDYISQRIASNDYAFNDMLKDDASSAFMAKKIGWELIDPQTKSLIAYVEQIVSQKALDALIRAKAQGATFGALSDREMGILKSAATKLGSWEIRDKNDKVLGYATDKNSFKKEIDNVRNSINYLLSNANFTVSQNDLTGTINQQIEIQSETRQYEGKTYVKVNGGWQLQQ